VALGYALLAATGWLAVALRQWIYRSRYIAAARQYFATGDGELGRRAMEVAGARLSETLIAAVLVTIFAFAAVALSRRTWNAWDWASAATGIATVCSTIFLCASGRVIYAAPFTLLPFWVLLYRPGVKAACDVGAAAPPTAGEGATDQVFAEQPPEVDLREEREKLVGLRQSLQVFEIERGMPTDTFVARYSQGLEEDTSDNEEWFALARMARRAEERITALNGHRPK
jgi:hypothetical protein